MLTKDELESKGWIFSENGDDGHGEKVVGNETTDLVDVTSSIPLFSLILAASAEEGQPIDPSVEITPDFVLTVSGETYTPDPIEPAPAPTPPVDQRVLDALESATLPDPSTASTEDVANSVNTVVDAVKQALATPQ